MLELGGCFIVSVRTAHLAAALAEEADASFQFRFPADWFCDREL
jgi:hypothetical protein